MSKQVAVIFDLDGVLIDTVDSHFAGWVAVAHELGAPFSRADNDNLRGVSRRDALAWLARHHEPLDRDREEFLLELKAQVYRAHVERKGRAIRVEGVGRLLQGLRERGIPIGLASASKHASMLLQMAGLDNMIDEVSDGNFGGRLKPHPEQLLDLAQRLGVAPAVCVVVEDSKVGLEAARRAGMRGVAIGAVAAEAGTVIGHLNSLGRVTIEEFLELVRYDFSS